MLTNTGPVAKLYLSIIDDVIDSIRELFLDEGLEDRVLDDLKHLWESKMMQSKAMEDLRKNNINSSNFVLQLPASYSHADRELAASVVIPASQNLRTFPVKSSSETLATFSLPAGLSYPVQIPAGVTLQTASGQLYKVNIPVVVTQAPAGQQALSKQHQKVPEWRKVHLPAAVPPSNAQEVAPPPAPVPPSAPQTNTSSASSQEPAAETPHSPQPQLPAEEDEASPQPLNLSTSAASSSCSQLSDFQNSAEETLTQTAHLKSRDIDDILKEVIEEEREKAARARSLAPEKTLNQADADLGLDLDFSYSELSDIVQLDGAVDNSDLEEDEGAPLEENDFLGMINAEAIRALQEGDGSSDGNSLSSSSDSEGADELAHVEEEDPLNSGDDVIEQDIPDLFDTENIIVCQYDKIHRSKNRWKFHLKDGVMCYGGRDYVFSKAVGEAEW